MKSKLVLESCLGVLLILLSSCDASFSSPESTFETSELAQEQALDPTDMTYATTPGEEIFRLPSDGEAYLYSDLSIGSNSGQLREYVDESGIARERWEIGLWIGNSQCGAARGRTLYVGDTVDFAGYRIRVVDITREYSVVTISRSTSSLVPCVPGLYNIVPQERLVIWSTESILIEETYEVSIGEPQLDEPINENGQLNQRLSVQLRFSTDNSTDVWEGIVYEGDSIEFLGNRIRILSLHEDSILLAIAKMDELESTP